MTQERRTRSRPGGGLLSIALALVVAGVATGQEAQRYVRAKSSAAAVRNWKDVQSDVLRDLEAGTVLRVYSEELGFLEVEAPGGLQVWVFGEYLEPAGEEGVLRATANLRMRPKPSSGPESMPVANTLVRSGEELRVLGRGDASKALAEDWVRVWSPQRARGWIRSADTEPMSDSEGAAAWQAAVREVEAQRATRRTTEAGAAQGDASSSPPAGPAAARPSESASPEVAAALQRADELFAAADAASGADYAGVIAAYRETAELAPAGSSTERIALDRLHKAEALQKIAEFEAALERKRVEQEQELERLREEQRNAERRKDPLMGRFAARGWVEKRQVGDEQHYYLRWGGERVAQILCSSGRYSLPMYLDYDIGITGAVVQAALPSTDFDVSRPRVIDLRRIEVLAGRPRR